MNKIDILTIAESVLGTYRQTGTDNYAFYCPYCKHYKKKLEINLETFNYHCWTCVPKRGGKNFYYLFRELNNITETQLEKIKEYTSTHVYKKQNNNKHVEHLKLPKEYKPLNQVWNSIEYKHAMVYLRKRNISELDIKKYNIGFCEDGEYEGRIIIPSYTENNELNYFVSRSFFDSPLKYKNAKVSRDIIMFENLISWNNPIILVEGVFDAMAIKRNSIPLLGKQILSKLKAKLDSSNVKDIYVCLDSDARQDAIRIAKELLSSGHERNIYLLKLDEKDPSEIGFKKMNEIIKSAPRFDFKNLIFTRLFE